MLRAATVVLSILALSEAHRHGNKRYREAARYAERFAPTVDDAFMEDCAVDTTPRGHYGAFFEPCTFTFVSAVSTGCDTGTVLSEPVSIIWPNNQTLVRTSSSSSSSDSGDSGESGDSGDSGDSEETGDSSDSGDRRRLRRLSSSSDSSDDMGTAEELALWPDQCVGAGSRCYPIEMFNQTLHKLFKNQTWPASATHVRVNCQADATEYNRVSYEMAVAEAEYQDHKRKVAITVSSIVIAVVAVLLCCVFMAVRSFCRRSQRSAVESNVVSTAPTAVAKAVSVGDDELDKTIDGSVDADAESKELIG